MPFYKGRLIEFKCSPQQTHTFYLFFPIRAARKLDGHKGDPAGRDGVQCEVPWYDSGGPT